MLRQRTKIFLWRRRKTEEEKRKIFGEGKYFVGRGEENRRRKMEKYLEKGNIFSGGKRKYLAGGGEEKQGKKRRKIYAEGKYLFPEKRQRFAILTSDIYLLSIDDTNLYNDYHSHKNDHPDHDHHHPCHHNHNISHHHPQAADNDGIGDVLGRRWRGFTW